MSPEPVMAELEQAEAKVDSKTITATAEEEEMSDTTALTSRAASAEALPDLATEQPVSEVQEKSSAKGITSARDKGKGPARPLITPRTSSLAPEAPPTPPTEQEERPEDQPYVWTEILLTGASYLGVVSDKKPSRESSPPSASLHRASASSLVEKEPKANSSVMADLDDESVKFLLKRLECQNQALTLNPKTVYVEDGSIRGYQPTLRNLTLKRRCDDGKDEDVQFWEELINDANPVAAVNRIPHLIRSKVRNGIPSSRRPQIWLFLSAISPSRFSQQYPLLLKQDSPYERIIRRDISRTFPDLEQFREGGEAQDKLFRILKAYSVYDPEVGYCQGLSFVVGVLIMQGLAEEQTFSLLIHLLSDQSNGPQSPPHGLRTLFTPTMPLLHTLLHLHTHFLHILFPNLHQHFATLGITSQMYASQWFLTLFVYTIPLKIIDRIWDLIFSEGAILTLLRFSIALLLRNESYLLSLTEFEDLLEALKGERLLAPYADSLTGDLVTDALSPFISDIITVQSITTLRHDYEVKQRLQPVTPAELSALHSLIRGLRRENERLMENLADVTGERDKLKEALDELKIKASSGNDSDADR
ncbi:rab-GTPase-TBC domain-containing protein [Gaertneriomyces semiglobifer]|nr:rab-GTPase-TBC domain-containing protein [Gaertneriomyces semiglobifer]